MGLRPGLPTELDAGGVPLFLCTPIFIVLQFFGRSVWHWWCSGNSRQDGINFEKHDDAKKE